MRCLSTGCRSPSTVDSIVDLCCGWGPARPAPPIVAGHQHVDVVGEPPANRGQRAGHRLALPTVTPRPAPGWPRQPRLSTASAADRAAMDVAITGEHHDALRPGPPEPLDQLAHLADERMPWRVPFAVRSVSTARWICSFLMCVESGGMRALCLDTVCGCFAAPGNAAGRRPAGRRAA